MPAQQIYLVLASEIRKEKDTLTVEIKCFQRRTSKRDIKHKSIAWIYGLFNKGYDTFVLNFDREDRYSSWLPSYATQSSSHEKLCSEMSLQGTESPCALLGRDSDARGICLLILAGCQQSALPVLPGHVPHYVALLPMCKRMLNTKATQYQRALKGSKKKTKGVKIISTWTSADHWDMPAHHVRHQSKRNHATKATSEQTCLVHLLNARQVIMQR